MSKQMITPVSNYDAEKYLVNINLRSGLLDHLI
jgi:hypothetical protein